MHAATWKISSGCALCCVDKDQPQLQRNIVVEVLNTSLKYLLAWASIKLIGNGVVIRTPLINKRASVGRNDSLRVMHAASTCLHYLQNRRLLEQVEAKPRGDHKMAPEAKDWLPHHQTQRRKKMLHRFRRRPESSSESVYIEREISRGFLIRSTWPTSGPGTLDALLVGGQQLQCFWLWVDISGSPHSWGVV